MKAISWQRKRNSYGILNNVPGAETKSSAPGMHFTADSAAGSAAYFDPFPSFEVFC